MVHDGAILEEPPYDGTDIETDDAHFSFTDQPCVAR